MRTSGWERTNTTINSEGSQPELTDCTMHFHVLQNPTVLEGVQKLFTLGAFTRDSQEANADYEGNGYLREKAVCPEFYGVAAPGSISERLGLAAILLGRFSGYFAIHQFPQCTSWPRIYPEQLARVLGKLSV